MLDDEAGDEVKEKGYPPEQDEDREQSTRRDNEESYKALTASAEEDKTGETKEGTEDGDDTNDTKHGLVESESEE